MPARFLHMAPLALGALLLPACGADGPDRPADGNVLLAEGAAGPAGAAADLGPRIIAAMGQILRDPASATYAEVRGGSGNSICGTVAFGGPAGAGGESRPFLVTPAGLAMISASSRVNVADPLDPFADAHMRWCASPEELRAMSEAIAKAPPLVVPEAPPAALPEPGPEPVPGEAPRRWRNAPPPAPGEPAGNDDSFSNAVLRGDR